MSISPELKRRLLEHQRSEITEYEIYRRIAGSVADPENRRVLERIAASEHQHYEIWRRYTGEDVEPDRWRIRRYYWIARILGFTFGAKLMERGETSAASRYGRLEGELPELEQVIAEEHQHEEELIEILDEERLRYTGSVVLGLNDALVELTGALAGFTLALQDTRLIALTGSITGIAAALSMGASEFLATRSEESDKHPLRASVYTTVAYFLTVVVLITPYLILENYYLCLALALVNAVAIIAAFNYYISVAKGLSFRSRFLEMTALSFAVGAVSFGIGYLMRSVLGIEA